MKFEKKLSLLLLLLLLWVFMLIKGYVVSLRAQGLGSRTSECAIKSLDNSSFKMDLYISGKVFLKRFRPPLNWARAQVTIVITAIILTYRE